MANTSSNWLKKFSVVLVLLLLLVLVFCLYFLKYIPEQRSDFHRNAFLELDNVESAIVRKDQGYNVVAQSKGPNKDKVQGTRIDFKPSKGWQFLYFYDTLIIGFDSTVYKKSAKRNEDKKLIKPDTTQMLLLSKSVDSIMSSIVAIYKDIFDGYLLIRTQENSDNEVDAQTKEGEIIYQSVDLSMDHNVSFDSIARNKNELGLPAFIDTKIEGNDYKMFLHPFYVGNSRVILAGVINQTNYNSVIKKIPFTLISAAAIIVLLLLIHLPILRIYFLGEGERIRDIDIRLIIGSYFIAAFVGFFLFSQAFLNNQADIQNEKRLSTLSTQISEQLCQEINLMVDQLKIFDNRYACLQFCKSPYLYAADTTVYSAEDVRGLDSIFQPTKYPFPEGVFWVNKKADWVARWAFKKSYRNGKFLNVSDREYFRDFVDDKAIFLDGKVSEPFTIQPTLSKRDGEFVVTVVIRSQLSTDEKDSLQPFLIGMSSQMYSISHVILPPGFGFSIVNQKGDVKFDSRVGRPLLSNIFKEMPDPSPLNQTIKFRTGKFFKNLTLRGKEVALLSRPMPGFPYQMLVYYNNSRSSNYAFHVIGISAFLTGCVLALLILTAMINQWSKNKFAMLQSKSLHFDWLHPSDLKLKKNYYDYLIRSMLALFAIYFFAWLIIEAFLSKWEISLLLLSMLFPFYVALLYYNLRQQFYLSNEMVMGRSRFWVYNTTVHLRSILFFIIILFNCLACFNNFSFPKVAIFLTVQIAWIILIYELINFYREKIAEIPTPRLVNIKADVPKAYVYAIIVGVTLISIIPASGIFWILHRHETSLNVDDDLLATAKSIEQRRIEIDQRFKDFKTYPADSNWTEGMNRLKFDLGIYYPGGKSFYDHHSYATKIPTRPAAEYVSAHNDFFMEDTMVQALSRNPYASEDNTWNFYRDSTSDAPRLIYRFKPDNVNLDSFQLEPDSSFNRNAISLLRHEMITGPELNNFLYYGLLFVSFALAIFLTHSLSRRVFLFALQKEVRLLNIGKTTAEKLFESYVDQHRLKSFVIDSCLNRKITSSIRDKVFIKMTFANHLSLNDVYMIEKNFSLSFTETGIIELIKIMRPMYEAFWTKINQHERFLLYDFALDGFANYKNTKELYDLQNLGAVFFDDLRLSPMTTSFQEFVLEKRDDKEIRDYIKKADSESTLKKFKGPFLVGLAALGIFLFVTQDTIYQKIMGLLTSSGSLISFLSDMLKRNGKADQ